MFLAPSEHPRLYYRGPFQKENFNHLSNSLSAQIKFCSDNAMLRRDDHADADDYCKNSTFLKILLRYTIQLLTLSNKFQSKITGTKNLKINGKISLNLFLVFA